MALVPAYLNAVERLGAQAAQKVADISAIRKQWLMFRANFETAHHEAAPAKAPKPHFLQYKLSQFRQSARARAESARFWQWSFPCRAGACLRVWVRQRAETGRNSRSSAGRNACRVRHW